MSILIKIRLEDKILIFQVFLAQRQSHSECIRLSLRQATSYKLCCRLQARLSFEGQTSSIIQQRCSPSLGAIIELAERRAALMSRVLSDGRFSI